MNKSYHLILGCILLCIVLLIPACASKQNIKSEVGSTMAFSGTYISISQDEAKKIMDEELDIIILDVRTPEEYESGHIVGAQNLDLATIADTAEGAIPDKDQTILVYCRSGVRSKQASQILADKGYTDIREFGGINTWEYEIE